MVSDERVVGGVLVGEQRVAAERRHLEGVEDRAEVGLPRNVTSLCQPPPKLTLSSGSLTIVDHLGVLRHALHVRVGVELAEAAPEAAAGASAVQRLVAEEDDVVSSSARWISATVPRRGRSRSTPLDLGADDGRHRLDADPLVPGPLRRRGHLASHLRERRAQRVRAPSEARTSHARRCAVNGVPASTRATTQPPKPAPVRRAPSTPGVAAAGRRARRGQASTPRSRRGGWRGWPPAAWPRRAGRRRRGRRRAASHPGVLGDDVAGPAHARPGRRSHPASPGAGQAQGADRRPRPPRTAAARSA